MARENSIEYKVVKQIGVVSERKGWKKELRIVKWGDYPEKYDLREWSDDGAKIGKGLTLSNDELLTLAKLIAGELKKK